VHANIETRQFNFKSHAQNSAINLDTGPKFDAATSMTKMLLGNQVIQYTLETELKHWTEVTFQ
jgi:hypothetical protein